MNSKKTLKKAILVLVVMVVILTSVVSCFFRRVEYKYPKNFIDLLKNRESEISFGDEINTSKNPGRGFSLTVPYYLGVERIDNNEADQLSKEYLDEKKKLYETTYFNEREVIQTIELDVYLNKYLSKKVDYNYANYPSADKTKQIYLDSVAMVEDLEKLKTFLLDVNKQDKAIIIRYLYQEREVQVEPQTDIVISHLELIAVWEETFSEYSKVILATKAGVVGVGGDEEKSKKTADEKNKIREAFYRIVPAKGLVLENSLEKYHSLPNSLVLNKTGITFNIDEANGNIKKYLKAPFKYKSETEFYGKNSYKFNKSTIKKAPASKEEAVQLIKGLHLRSTSIINIEDSMVAINALKDIKIGTIDLRRVSLPIYDRWFINSSKEQMNKTALNYLESFLGYNLVFTKSSEIITSTSTTITIEVCNIGMAAPFAVESVKLAIGVEGDTQYLSTGATMNINVFKLRNGEEDRLEHVFDGPEGSKRKPTEKLDGSDPGVYYTPYIYAQIFSVCNLEKLPRVQGGSTPKKYTRQYGDIETINAYNRSIAGMCIIK